jgi:outer membrane protein assembly factor BamB
VGADSTIYFGSDDNYLYALNSDGTLKWRYETGDVVHSSPAIGPDGVVYVGSSDNYIYAVTPDGTLQWRYQTGHDVISSQAVSGDGIIYVGSNDGYLYALNPTGVLRWRYQTNGAIYSSPTVGSDGTILVGSNDFHLYAINPDGSLKWRYATSGPVASSPAIGNDGSVYFGSWDNYLYSLNVPDGEVAIYGVVTDISTGAPLTSATVTTIGGTTQTGTRGEFVLVLNPGVYTLTITKTGYATLTTSSFYAGSGSAVTIDVNMTTPGSLNIVTSALASAEVDIPYNERVRISGGTYPYAYALTNGSLPPGLSLDTEYGNVSGTPTTAGSYTFMVSVTDYLGAYADHEYTVDVTEVLEFVTDMILPRATQGDA